jgi:hypothetical protein
MRRASGGGLDGVRRRSGFLLLSLSLFSCLGSLVCCNASFSPSHCFPVFARRMRGKRSPPTCFDCGPESKLPEFDSRSLPSSSPLVLLSLMLLARTLRQVTASTARSTPTLTTATAASTLLSHRNFTMTSTRRTTGSEGGAGKTCALHSLTLMLSLHPGVPSKCQN